MIQRTFDYRIVNRFASWPVIVSSEIFYLIERNGEENWGLWALHEHEDGVMIHADMGSKCRGKKAIESIKNAFKWIFSNTGFKKIYAGIPKDNKPACIVASMGGMQFTGLNNNLRNFVLIR